VSSASPPEVGAPGTDPLERLRWWRRLTLLVTASLAVTFVLALLGSGTPAGWAALPVIGGLVSITSMSWLIRHIEHRTVAETHLPEDSDPPQAISRRRQRLAARLARSPEEIKREQRIAFVLSAGMLLLTIAGIAVVTRDVGFFLFSLPLLSWGLILAVWAMSAGHGLPGGTALTPREKRGLRNGLLASILIPLLLLPAAAATDHLWWLSATFIIITVGTAALATRAALIDH
jgi:hypothetical protein